MYCLLIKNLRGNYIGSALSRPLRYRLMSYKNENIIGGGLEKPQGGLREERYFSEQDNNLIAKMRFNDTKVKLVSDIGNCTKKLLDAKISCTTLRDTCSLNKQKNCLEEAFFLNEQTECCGKLCKDNFQEMEVNQEANTDKE